LIFVLVLGLFCVISSSLPSQVESESLFSDYVKKYEKPYANHLNEYQERFKHFQNSLKRIDSLNRKYNPMTQFATNKFSDMSVEEFKSTYLMKKMNPQDLAPSCFTPQSLPTVNVKDLPESIDWRQKGVINPIKDQGMCGSCWAFSVVGNMESQYAIKYNKLLSFSEQMIVDCSKGCTEAYNQKVCNMGCNGGWMWTAMYDIIGWKGIESEQDYPYTARDSQCNKDNTKLIPSLVNYTCLSGSKGPASEDAMTSFLAYNGTLSVALNADLLMDYSSGIINPFVPSWECDPTAIDHAVVIVGYGQEYSWGIMTKYWIVRNSWGQSWGEKGYFRLYRGEGLCGINTAVLYAEM